MPTLRPDRITDESIELANLLKILGEVDKGKLKSFSDLEEDEVFVLTLLYSLAEKTNADVIRSICNNFLALRLSRLRLSRREIVLLVSLFSSGVMPKGGLRDLLKGKI